MENAKEAGKFFFNLVMFLGALACVLVWAGIKPQDLRMTGTLPHWGWLVAAILLFAGGMFMSIKSFYRSTREITASRQGHENQLREVRTACDAASANYLRQLEEKGAAITQLRTALEMARIKHGADQEQIDELKLAPRSLLTIHSATYGTGDRFENAIDGVNRIVRDALVIPVSNNLVPTDPDQGQRKWLTIDYSYANQRSRMVQRFEGTTMVLPEETPMSMLEAEAFRLAKEIDDWAKEIGPRAYPMRGEDEDGAVFLKRVRREMGPYEDKLTFGFRNNFQDRVVQLALRFAEQGNRDFALEQLTGIVRFEQVADVAAKLRSLACQSMNGGAQCQSTSV